MNAHGAARNTATGGEGIAALRHIASVYWMQQNYEYAIYYAKEAYGEALDAQRSDLVWFLIILTKSRAIWIDRPELEKAFKLETKYLREARKKHRGSLSLKAWERAHVANYVAYLIATTRIRGAIIKVILRVVPSRFFKSMLPVQREYLVRMRNIKRIEK